MFGSRERIWLAMALVASAVGALYAYLTNGTPSVGAVTGFLIGGGILGIEMYVIQREPGARLRRLPVPVFIALSTAIWAIFISIALHIVPLVMLGHLYDGTRNVSFFDDLVFALFASVVFNSVLRIRSLIGPRVFSNFMLGRYHRPMREARIFMFLDLADSTSLSLRLGDERVQELIGQFFFDIAAPISRAGGETHRYIGDEVVVTWPLKGSDDNARCLSALADIAQVLAHREAFYKKNFDVVPNYRVALHCGEVVAGEVGDTKREIVYFGDTINTAARLGAHCKVAGEATLASGAVLDALALPEGFAARSLGSTELRGRNEPLDIFGIDLPGDTTKKSTRLS